MGGSPGGVPKAPSVGCGRRSPHGGGSLPIGSCPSPFSLGGAPRGARGDPQHRGAAGGRGGRLGTTRDGAEGARWQLAGGHHASVGK